MRASGAADRAIAGDPFPPVPGCLDSYPDFLQFLFGRKASGVKLGLENTRLMLERLGHPHRGLAAFHVAGTNGKGSTSAILAAILEAGGCRTGLYTSPHLLDYRERIRVGGVPACPEDLMDACERIRPHLSEIPLTFFEITTLLGILTFVRQKVDVAVMEVGLGGRLDATNILDEPFPVITGIQFDHEGILGKRLVEIASEKAGIIRGSRPVITGVRRRAVLDLLAKRCRETGAPLLVLKDEARWRIRESSWGGTRFLLRTKEHRYDNLTLPLPGVHQVANAALAVRAVEVMSRVLGLGIRPEHVRRGLRDVVWPGRFQVLSGPPRIVLDVAHNPGGARVLARTLKNLCPEGIGVLVLGMLQEKKHVDVLRQLAPLARRVVVTSPDSDRAASLEALASAARGLGIEPVTVPEVGAALKKGISIAGRDETVVVAGSCYTVGEALRSLGIEDAWDQSAVQARQVPSARKRA
ncbi:MAG: bifunctional folylpolyglutamate synthase/dihydrofolate synthase [Candidatus Eisenbacteria sp.]|nr:bifunctional folylpolyglutamate synthase/dihydrofolate synthase [Candidatus Eisenbacteria bacterium]